MTSFYSADELKNIGFAYYGENVLISRKTSIYDPQSMHIGNNVRIDDYCVLSGNIILGNYIHISAGVMLFAGHSGIEIKDFSGLSSRCAVHAESDDFSGATLTNPMVPIEYRRVTGKKVVLEKHVLVGSGSTILPGVNIGEGTSVGSMSLVNKSLKPWGIYVGVPCERVKERSREILTLEAEFLKRTLEE